MVEHAWLFIAVDVINKKQFIVDLGIDKDKVLQVSNKRLKEEKLFEDVCYTLIVDLKENNVNQIIGDWLFNQCGIPSDKVNAQIQIMWQVFMDYCNASKVEM